MTGDTSVDAHLAGDGGAAAPKAAPDWKPGYFRAIARKKAPGWRVCRVCGVDEPLEGRTDECCLMLRGAMCVFDDAGNGSAGSTVEQAGIGNSEPAASANSLNSADTHRADTHRERRIARTVEQTGNEDEDPGETCFRLCSGVPPPAASRSVSSSASDSEEEWMRQHPEPFEGAKELVEKLRRKKHERNDQRHRSASKLCKYLNRGGRCPHGCTPTKTYCHKYHRGQCHRGLDCRYAHSE